MEWIKIFGPMKYLLMDTGKKWLNQELWDFCHYHDIRMTPTNSYTPNANGIVERILACADRMLEKMCTADPTLQLQIA